jgi:hypothetical protein
MQAMGREVFPSKWCGFNNINVGLATPQQGPIKPYIHIPHFSVYPRLVMHPEEVYTSDISYLTTALKLMSFQLSNGNFYPGCFLALPL